MAVGVVVVVAGVVVVEVGLVEVLLVVLPELKLSKKTLSLKLLLPGSTKPESDEVGKLGGVVDEVETVCALTKGTPITTTAIAAPVTSLVTLHNFIIISSLAKYLINC